MQSPCLSLSSSSQRSQGQSPRPFRAATNRPPSDRLLAMPTFTCQYNYHLLSVEATFDKRGGNAAHLICRALTRQTTVKAISREFNDALLRLAYTPYPTSEHLMQMTTQGYSGRGRSYRRVDERCDGGEEKKSGNGKLVEGVRYSRE